MSLLYRFRSTRKKKNTHTYIFGVLLPKKVFGVIMTTWHIVKTEVADGTKSLYFFLFADFSSRALRCEGKKNLKSCFLLEFLVYALTLLVNNKSKSWVCFIIFFFCSEWKNYCYDFRNCVKSVIKQLNHKNVLCQKHVDKKRENE